MVEADFLAYKAIKNKTNILMNEARKVFFKDFVEEKSTDQRKLFSANKRLLGRKHMVEYPQFDDKFIMILVITGNKTLMQKITSVVGIGSSKHDFFGCGLNKFSDIRLAEYINSQ